jgi:hypothetical protein
MTTQQLVTTRDAIRAGTYDWQRIGAIVLAACSAVEALHLMGEAVPPAARGVVAAVHGWTVMIGVVVSTLLAKLGKPVFVQGEG